MDIKRYISAHRTMFELTATALCLIVRLSAPSLPRNLFWDFTKALSAGWLPVGLILLLVGWHWTSGSSPRQFRNEFFFKTLFCGVIGVAALVFGRKFVVAGLPLPSAICDVLFPSALLGLVIFGALSYLALKTPPSVTS